MRFLYSLARLHINLGGIILFGFLFIFDLAAQPETSTCDSGKVHTMAAEAFTSRLSALKVPPLPPGTEPSEEDLLRAQEYQYAVRFFEEVTGIPSEFNYHAGSIPSSEAQLQSTIRRWQSWRVRNEGDTDSDILICLIDRDMALKQKQERQVHAHWSELGALIFEPWVGLNTTALYESLWGHSAEAQGRFVSIISLEPTGEFLLLQWSVDSWSPLSVKSAIDKLPDIVALGFWALEKDHRLKVWFSVFDECFAGDQCPPGFVDELARVGADVEFRGARFKSGDEFLGMHGFFSFSDHISCFRKEHQRCLLWMQH